MSLIRNHLPSPIDNAAAQGYPVRERSGKWRTCTCFNCGHSRMRVNSETGAFACMSGCGARGGDVVAMQMAIHGQDFVTACKALGAWQDDPKDTTAPRRRPLPFPARDALEVLVEEANFCAVIAGNVAHGVAITADDRMRTMQCAGRIRTIARHVQEASA